ncbi:MAG: hypothetical protein GC168_14090 [Candidatus Hydrogenedens sp.]|nr:hypothetical protein [Candidatus Hydrogenedens sp.]
MTMPRILFQESQRFTQAFLWVPLTLLTSFVSGTTLWMIMRQVVNEIPFGDEPISNEMLLGLGGAVIGVNALIVVFFATARMQTEVTSDGLFIRFFPFHRRTRKIGLENVETMAAVTYRSLLEYGGYGIRRYPKATAYNVRGLEGVRINYENGVHVMIGTQHPEALFNALQTVLEHQAGADTEGGHDHE